jgi:hypothetical protein
MEFLHEDHPCPSDVGDDGEIMNYDPKISVSSNVFDEAHTSCPEQPVAKGSKLMINHDVTALQSRAGAGRTD